MRLTAEPPVAADELQAPALGFGLRLARPGGNITGATLVAGAEVGGKYLELLKNTVPKISRVAVLVRPESSSHALVL